jgi:hypothetical protein
MAAGGDDDPPAFGATNALRREQAVSNIASDAGLRRSMRSASIVVVLG